MKRRVNKKLEPELEQKANAAALHTLVRNHPQEFFQYLEKEREKLVGK